MKTPLGPVLASLLACLGTPAEARQDAAPQEKGSATPGSHLTYEETSRGMEQGFDMVHYAFKADGLPKDQPYAMYGRWMDGRSAEVTRGIRINESGYLRDPKGQEFTLSLGRMFPGEYVAFALVSEDGTVKAFLEITPFPIQAEGKGGCRLAVRPMDPRGQGFLITGSGFGPNKKLKIVSISVNEIASSTRNAGPDGALPKQVIFPAVVRRTGGDASLEVSDSDCSVKVRYKWGDEMRAPTAAERQPTP